MTRASARLLGAIQADRAVLGALRGRITEALDERPWAQGAPILYLVAVKLEHYYTAAEAILDRIAREFEGPPPPGPRWHNDLLDQLGHPIPDTRPAVLCGETVHDLRELLSFRHFMRHAYAVELEPERLGDLAKGLTLLDTRLAADLDVFERLLRGTEA